MSGPIASYFATVGVAVDPKSLTDVDKYLKSIEDRVKKNLVKGALNISLTADYKKFANSLQREVNKVFKSQPFTIHNVRVNPARLKASLVNGLGAARVDITPTASQASLRVLRTQVKAALQQMPIFLRLGGVTGGIARSYGGVGTGSRGTYTGEEAARRRASRTGRGDPSMMERVRGRPGRDDLSAANRRYYDATVSKSLQGMGGRWTGEGTVLGGALHGGLSLLGNASSKTMGGRLGEGFGTTFLAPLMRGNRATASARGGLAGMLIGAVPELVVKAGTQIWGAAAATVMAPFRLLGSAINTVTSSFYRLAQTLLPFGIAGMYIDKKVRESTTQGIAIDTTARRYGSTGNIERSWLRGVADQAGANMGSLVDPFASFISASSPSMGLERSKSVFASMTRYGMAHGATDYSMQNALKAFGQMAGKGTVQLEELKNQVGDAQGFGGMLPIFADAYQEVLGRTGDSKKTGQKAIEELLDATQKGKVVTAKILPIVERIADEMSAQSIEKIRQSSSGQRNTFLNQLGGFWTKFTEGGGERGMTLFWTRMQEFGTWLESNGRKFGEQFEGFMKWGDVAYEAIKQSISFMFTGKENEVTQMLHDGGIDITGLRESVVLFLNQLSDTVSAIAKATGFIQNEDGTGGLVNKLSTLTKNLQEIFRHLGLMLNSIAIAITSFDKWLELPLSSKVRSFIDINSEGAQLLGGAMAHTGIAVGHTFAGTKDVAGATYDLWAGKSPKQRLGLTVGQEETARQDRLINLSQLDAINSRDAAARAAEASLNRYNQAFSDNTVPPMSSSFGGNTTPVQVNVSIGADAEKLGVTMEQVYVNREQAAFAGALVNNAPKIK